MIIVTPPPEYNPKFAKFMRIVVYFAFAFIVVFLVYFIVGLVTDTL